MTDVANPRRRLALRTSSPQCVPSGQNAFMTTVFGIFNSCITDSSCNGSSLSITVADLGRPPKRPSNLKMAFNIHNAHQHHRDRCACRFLLVS